MFKQSDIYRNPWKERKIVPNSKFDHYCPQPQGDKDNFVPCLSRIKKQARKCWTDLSSCQVIVIIATLKFQSGAYPIPASSPADKKIPGCNFYDSSLVENVGYCLCWCVVLLLFARDSNLLPNWQLTLAYIHLVNCFQHPSQLTTTGGNSDLEKLFQLC